MAQKTYPVTFTEYMAYRKLGFRAITAFGITKYGMNFLFELIIEDEA